MSLSCTNLPDDTMNASLASLQERLQNLNESIQQTTNLIQRLSTLQPQLRTSDPTRLPDAESSLETVTDLSAEIHDVLKQQEEDLALLRQDVDDETAPRGFGLGSRRSGTGRQEGDRGRFGNSLAEGCESLTEELKKCVSCARLNNSSLSTNAETARALAFAMLNSKQNAMLMLHVNKSASTISHLSKRQQRQ